MDQPFKNTSRVLVFVGPMSYPASKNLRNACCGAVNDGVAELIIQFSSSGGPLTEAFSIYHFLKSLPLKVTTHNIDVVESSANIVFLAGKTRLCCAESRFMFHAFDWSYAGPQTLLPERLVEHAASVANYQTRFFSVLKGNTSLTDKDLDELQLLHKATFIEPGRAKEMGIVQDVKEATVPTGTLILNVEY